MVQNLGGKLIFNNDVINKKKLQRLMLLTAACLLNGFGADQKMEK